MLYIGSVLQTSCIVCGSKVHPGYKYCVSCGRAIGSDRLDPAAARAAQRRLSALQETESENGKTNEEPEYVQESPEPVVQASGNAEDHNRKGQEYFENNNLEQAIEEFKAAVSMEPGNSSYHCNLAIAYDENDQDEEALGEYEKTLELNKNDLTALLSLGYMYSENDEDEKAKEYWNKIVEIAPMSAEAQEAKENLRHIEEL